MKDIQERLKEAETNFDTLKKEIESMQEQVNEGNRQIAARREEMTRLQGEYRALKSLLPEKEREKLDKADEEEKNEEKK